MCDFDGTITVQDTAEWILEQHSDGDWKALDESYTQGRIGLLQCMKEQFAMVKLGQEDLLTELDSAIELRPGFAELVGICREREAGVLIVSAGLDFVIEHYMRKLGLDSFVRLYSARTRQEDGHISFDFPPLVFQSSKTFKDDVVRRCQEDGKVVTYIGDGTPDAEACALADHRFAVRGRRLEAIMMARGLDHMAFDDFHSIIPTIKVILAR